jgi:hypothetical protein
MAFGTGFRPPPQGRNPEKKGATGVSPWGSTLLSGMEGSFGLLSGKRDGSGRQGAGCLFFVHRFSSSPIFRSTLEVSTAEEEGGRGPFTHLAFNPDLSLMELDNGL